MRSIDRLCSQRRTEQGPALVQRLFRGTGALEVSRQVRLRKECYTAPALGEVSEGEADTALTYGEIVPASFFAIMNSIRAPLLKLRGCSSSQGLVFYDLGSGQGKACFAALLEPNCYFRKVVGIEIMSELVGIAVHVKERLFAAMELAEGAKGTGGASSPPPSSSTAALAVNSKPDLEMISYVKKLIIDSNGSIERERFANVLSKKLGSKAYKKNVLQVYGSYTKFLEYLFTSKAILVDYANCLVIADSNVDNNDSDNNDSDNNDNDDNNNDNNDNDDNNNDNNNDSDNDNDNDNISAIVACLANPRAAGILPSRQDIDLTFIEGDIFDSTSDNYSCWSKSADVCYCANLLFSESMMRALSRKVAGMKAGAVFISLRRLDDSIIVGRVGLLEESFYKMSWHFASVFVYQVLSNRINDK